MCRLLLLVLLALPLAAQNPTLGPPGPWDRPELDTLLDACCFYVSFDHGFRPDLAAGETFAPRLEGTYDKTTEAPARAPSWAGEALVLATGAATYPVAGNFPVNSRGAMTLWIKPVDWQRPRGSNVTFVIVHGGRFYLQRQGPMIDDEGRLTRHEQIQFLAKSSPEQRQYCALASGTWENDTWHFLVANWDWPTMQVSIDGQPFAVQSLPGRPEPGTHGGYFLVGSRGGDGGLLDELMVFDRPLDITEVTALHAAGRAALAAAEAAGE